MTNPNFEIDGIGWTKFSGDDPDIQFVSTEFTEGAKSLRLSSDVVIYTNFTLPERYDFTYFNVRGLEGHMVQH